MAKVYRTTSILLLGIFLCMRASTIEGNQETEKMLSFCDTLINDNSYYHQYSMMEQWLDEEHQAILEENKEAYLAEYMLIQGELQMYQGHMESAIDKLKNATVLAGEEQVELKVKACTEVIRAFVSGRKYELVEDKLNELELLYSKNDITDSMVHNGVTTCYALLDVPNGNKSALELMKMIKQGAELVGYEDMPYILYNMGIFWDENNQNVLAINYFNKAIELANQKNSKEYDTRIFLEIAYLYMKEGNYQAALEYLNSIELHKRDSDYMQNLQQRYELYYSVYMGLEEYDLAQEYLKKDYEVIKELSEMYNLEDYFAQYNCLYASYLVQKGRFEEAISYIDEANEIYQSSKAFIYTNFELDIMTRYADVYFMMEDYEKAADCYQMVYDMYLQKGYETPTAEVVWRTYKSYEKTNNTRASVYADRAFAQIRQQLKQAEEQQAIYRFEEYMYQKREDEIKNLTARNHIIIQIAFLLFASVTAAIAFIILAVRKNSKIRELNAKLEEMNGKDALTGLYNRRTLERELQEAWITSPNRAVAMIDVDFFKMYNDTYGHQKGDMVLKLVAECVKERIDESCIAARYGGEEFVILFMNHKEEDVVRILNQIRTLLQLKEIPHKASLIDKYVTLSIGYTMAGDKDGECAICDADKALYIAKETRNTIQAYVE